MAARKRYILSHEEIEQFLFEENSKNESEIDALVAIKVLQTLKQRKKQFKNNLATNSETQVLENQDLPDESQQEITPENLIAN